MELEVISGERGKRRATVGYAIEAEYVESTLQIVNYDCSKHHFAKKLHIRHVSLETLVEIRNTKGIDTSQTG